MADELNSFLAAGQSSFSTALFDHYAQSDLTHSEFLVYLFLSQWAQTHTEAPEPDGLAARLKMTPGTLYATINSLLQKQAVALVSFPDGHGHTIDQYDVTPLLRRLLDTPQATTTQAEANATSTVFNQIEIEFARPLSPIEQQTIADWLNIDHYNPKVIQLALREAVLNQKYSLRYIDRILINWEKLHLTTPQQVQTYLQQRNQL
ncbi:DnaD domain-containing protein [Lacticaseibacillus baoqingensis]|uniref:DnaD domain-containing protein n=1 Tax=Lacticaseibacillus baoqingensis TaxID=2486013 RepID=A0ABW4E8Y7_9LACO|nr:DnaD domain protein [Lacticaseibacillus baoqingensis]